MKITLIEPRGFCFGVCRALQMLDSITDKQPYVLHEIVHNKQIVQEYQNKGVHFVNALSEIPPDSTVAFSAHGVGRDIEQKARWWWADVIDMTCPFVQKVHQWACLLEKEGYTVVLIGKKGHDEIEGTLGQLQHPEKAFVIASKADVEKLPHLKQVGVATQTTFSVDETADIISELKKRFPDTRLQNGICFATTERQRAVKEASQTNDIILVVGDKKSSNANRLVEVAQNAGAKSFLIETVADVQCLSLTGNIAITAAASAPESIVKQVYDYLKTLC